MKKNIKHYTFILLYDFHPIIPILLFEKTICNMGTYIAFEGNRTITPNYTSEDLNPHTKGVLGFNSLLACDRCKIKMFHINSSMV